MATQTLETEEKIFTKSAPLYFKSIEEDGTIEAIVSVFGNRDFDGDVTMYGAFKRSLEEWQSKGSYPPGGSMHNWDTMFIRTDEARELAPGDPLLPEKLTGNGGLYVKGKFNLSPDDPDARKYYSRMKFGIPYEFSYAYGIRDADYDRDTNTQFLKDLDLREWSIVLKGANSLTAMVGIKQDYQKPEVKKQDPPEELSTEQKFTKTISRILNLTPAMVKAGALSGDDRAKVDEAVDRLQALLDATAKEKGEAIDKQELVKELTELRGEIGKMNDERRGNQ